MSITTLNKELWSSVLIKGTQGQIAYQECVQNIGKVTGKEVHFTNIGDITVSSYVKDTNISNQTLTDTGFTLALNQQDYFAVNVDDIDEAQTDAAVMAEIARKGTIALSKEIEQYLASLYVDAGITSDLGNDTTPIEINSSNVLTYLRLISRKLDEADADISSRWCVVPPWFKEDLSIALPAIDTDNSEMLKSGYVGMFSGLKLYMSNNVPNTTSAKYKIMAGDGDAFRFGMNIDKLETLRNPNQFGTILRGLMVYGAKTTQSSTLACLTANEAAEA